MQFSYIVFGVAVIIAPRGADCASKTEELEQSLIPEHAETSNTEETKYLESLWDLNWGYMGHEHLDEVAKFGVVHSDQSGNAENRIASAPDATPQQIERWQTTLKVMMKIISELNEVERGDRAERNKYRIGWNLAKPRWDEIERARKVKSESFNGIHVDLLKSLRREHRDARLVVFDGSTLEYNPRKVIVEYRSTWLVKSVPQPNWLLDPLFHKFLYFEVLDRLNVKGLAPVPVGLSSPALAPDHKVCVADDRLLADQCIWLPRAWWFRGLVTEPLLDETNNNIAKLANEFLAVRNEQIKIMSDESEKTKMKNQVFVDIIKIGGLIIDALEKLHDIGIIYTPLYWGKAIRVAETSNGLAVQLVDFRRSFLYPPYFGMNIKGFSSPSRRFGDTPGQLLGDRFLRQDDIYGAIEFVADMMGAFNPDVRPNSLYEFLEFEKSDVAKLYLFKRFGSLFLDVRDIPSTRVDYDRVLGSKRVVTNAYCQNFGLSSEKGNTCITALGYLDDALLRVQFQERIDTAPDYENIKNSFANALIEANKLLIEEFNEI